MARGVLTDLTGRRFGHFTAIRRIPVAECSRNFVYWECLCDCGSVTAVRARFLVEGQKKNCGCMYRLKTHGHARKGARRAKEYCCWVQIKDRCYNPRRAAYAWYGGRGIVMCDAWKDSYETFLRDMGPRPPNHSIDRIDPNGNYEPGNCRWASRLEQANNKRSSVVLEFNGQRLTVNQWARLLHVPSTTIRRRLQLKWPIERVLTAERETRQEQ